MAELIEDKIKENNEQTENKKDKFEVIRQVVFIIVGFINIIFAHSLRGILPYIIGISSVATGAISLIKNIKEKEYATLETMIIPSDVVGIILGIKILIENENAVPFIAIAWGISGLRKGTKGLNVAVYNKFNKKPFALELVHSIFEIFFAILLIFDPFEKLEEHLILLGIEMIISSLKICFKDKEYEKIEE